MTDASASTDAEFSAMLQRAQAGASANSTAAKGRIRSSWAIKLGAPFTLHG